MTKRSTDQFSPEEAKRRMEAALRGARIAGSKPMTGTPKKPARKRRPKAKAKRD